MPGLSRPGASVITRACPVAISGDGLKLATAIARIQSLAARWRHYPLPRPGLHLRFMLPLVGVFMIAALLGWWASSRLLATTLEARQQALVERTAELLAGGLFPLTPELLERVALLTDARVFLLDAGGRPLSISPHMAVLPSLKELESGIVDSGGEPQIVAVRPLGKAPPSGAARIAVTISLAHVRAAVNQAALTLGLVAVLAVFLLSWLAHRLAAGVTKPLDALIRMAARIAAGERELAAPVEPGPQEIAALADALEHMVTRLRETEAEAARQARLAGLGAMAARVAHEVRNPLTAMTMQLQLLREDLPTERRRDVDALLNEARRLALLVDGIVDHGRPLRLQPRPTDLNRLAADVSSLFAPQMRHRQILLERDLDEGLPLLDLDPDRTKQMLVNLLVNARDALPNGGHICLATTADSDSAMLSVEDSGPGLPEERFAAILSGHAGHEGFGLRMTAQLAGAQGATLATMPSTLGGAALVLRFSLSSPDAK